jgi:hypothetical protein
MRRAIAQEKRAAGTTREGCAKNDPAALREKCDGQSGQKNGPAALREKCDGQSGAKNDPAALHEKRDGQSAAKNALPERPGRVARKTTRRHCAKNATDSRARKTRCRNDPGRLREKHAAGTAREGCAKNALPERPGGTARKMRGGGRSRGG